MKAIAEAPGKIILVGEHFVVYNRLAIVMAINRYVRVMVEESEDKYLCIASDLGAAGRFFNSEYVGTAGDQKILEPIRIAAQSVLDALNEKVGLKITVNSTIPMAVGLGSSGSLAVATVTAVARFLGKTVVEKQILELSLNAEKFVHINPSGIDQAIATYGGVITYKRSEGIARLERMPSIPIVIGNTGIQRNTGHLVEGVRIKTRKFPTIMERIFDAAEHVSDEAIVVLQANDLERLGALMNINHGLLISIGVSHHALDQLVSAAREEGALGAKLTGAGGGGCMIALAPRDRLGAISNAIHESGSTPLIVEKVDRGVHSWISE